MKSKWFSWTWPNFSGRPVDLTSSDVSFADIRSYVSTPRSLATWVWRISTPGLRSLGCFDWQVFFGRLAVWLNRIEYTQHISQYLSCCFLFRQCFGGLGSPSLETWGVGFPLTHFYWGHIVFLSCRMVTVNRFRENFKNCWVFLLEQSNMAMHAPSISRWYSHQNLHVFGGFPMAMVDC